jgi:hypothetical protein
MNTKETLQSMEKWTEDYLRQLHAYDLEQLLKQPSEQEWSLGQVYVHLIQTAERMQLRNAMLCKEPAAAEGGGKTEAGEAVFGMGGFPPTKIQVPPSPQYTPRQPEGKEELVQGMRAVLEAMKELEPTLEGFPLHHTVAHPRLGGLNAVEWFQLIEMHYRHHLQQVERLKQCIEASE